MVILCEEIEREPRKDISRKKNATALGVCDNAIPPRFYFRRLWLVRNSEIPTTVERGGIIGLRSAQSRLTTPPTDSSGTRKRKDLHCYVLHHLAHHIRSCASEKIGFAGHDGLCGLCGCVAFHKLGNALTARLLN